MNNDMDGKKGTPRTMRCNVKICEAACCYNVPMPKGYLSAYRKRIVNAVIRVEDIGEDNIVAWTDDDIAKNKCPFLTASFRCNIYEARPHICRIFGDGKESIFLNCEYRTGKPIPSFDEILAANKDVLKRLKEK